MMPLLLIVAAVAAYWYLSQNQGARAAEIQGPPAPSAPNTTDFGGVMSTMNIWAEEVGNQRVVNVLQGWSVVNGVDVRLTAAIARTESSFRVDAKNPADPSYGLMGISPLIAKAYGGWHPASSQEAIKEPDTNVRAGTGFLKHLLSRYGNLEAAIQAYNLGETKYDRGVRSPDYLNKVLTAYNRYGGGLS
jgi:soluble lytic murein transglycosylase-like protein